MIRFERMVLIAALLCAPAHRAAASDAVDAAALMRDVAALADDRMEGRQTATAGAARARAYIAARWRALGLTAREERFRFTSRNAAEREGVDLWVRIEGRSAPGRHIVVTAHYDHDGIRAGVIHNGADDNASGVATLLAIAAALQRAPPEHSVLLVALDAEEPLPGMFGSRAFVATPPVPLASMLLNINLDMVSRSAAGELWAAGAARHPALRPALERVAAAAPVRLRLGHDVEGDAGDWTHQTDQAPFHRAGIPFVYFGVEDHPDYHRPTDDVERIDADFFGRSARTVLMGLRALDAEAAALAEAREAAAPRS